jgi:hypothetical protein
MPDPSQASSSMQIIEAARTQGQSAEESQLGQLYDPNNKMRETYLRAKYQMYVNKRIH